jgi:hypothetical protein
VCAVVGLTGLLAVLAIDLFIPAENDEIAARFQNPEPLVEYGFGVLLIFQEMRGVSEV